MKKVRSFSKIISLVVVGVLFVAFSLSSPVKARALTASMVKSKLDMLMTIEGFKCGGYADKSMFYKGSQCYGFVDLVSRKLYGHEIPSYDGSARYRFVSFSNNFIQVGSTLTVNSGNMTLSNLKALFAQSQSGDIIQMDYTKRDSATGNTAGTSNHTMIIYSVSNTGAVFYHSGSSYQIWFGASSNESNKNPLYSTTGKELTWEKFIKYFCSSGDGISIYRSKKVDGTTADPAPIKTTSTGYSSTNPDDYTYPTRSLTYTSPTMKGNDVAWVQAVLYRLGYSIEIDGSYGKGSVSAVKEFQTKYGLTVDGNCGPATRAKLLEVWNSKKHTTHSYSNACDATCNVCGATRTPAEHKWSNKYCGNGECTVCGTYRVTFHRYSDATCTTPRKCQECGLTDGSALGHKYTNDCDTSCNTCGAKRSITHNYAAATCTKAKTCKVCGATSGSALDHKYTNGCDTTCNTCGAKRSITHNYAAATCTKAKTCKVCGATTGSALGHKHSNACDTTCNTCGAKRTITHGYSAATCTKAKTCKVCGTTSGSSLGHKYSNACDTTCNTCGAKRTITHSYSAATCTKAKTCKVCSATSGSALGHKYSNDCDATCNTCGAKRTVEHTYKTTTTKATLKKNGSVVKECTECGEIASKKTVKKIKSVKLSKTSYTYNGKTKTPSVVVKDSAGKTLKKGTDYTVTYAKGRKTVGTYKVTIKFKGNYSGTKVLTFKITPPKTVIKKVTPANDALKISIDKETKQVTGYQVQYSTSKTFKKATTKTVKSYKTTSLTLKKLKSNKKYFVRVRTFKTVKGAKIYSGWSSYKTARTK